MRSKTTDERDVAEEAGNILPLGQARQGKSYVVVVKIKALEGNSNVVILPRRDCVHAPSLLRLLADAGARLDGGIDQVREISQQIASGSLPTVDIASVSGWYGPAYLYANEFIGKPEKPFVIVPPDPTSYTTEVSPDGSVRKWTAAMSRLARHSPFLAFGIGLGFASTIAGPLKIAPRMFHFYGPSTEGKSVLLTLARGVSGNCSRTGMANWHATVAGVEELAAECRDQLFAIDEASYLGGSAEDEKVLRLVAYGFNAQQPKRRSKHYQPSHTVAEEGSSKMGASNGELPMGEISRKAGLKRQRGAELRAIDVRVDQGDGMGVFSNLPDEFSDREDGARAFAQQLEAAANHHRGRPGGAFLDHVIHKPTWKQDAERRMDDFRQLANVGGDAYELRFLEPFELVYAACREAQIAGIVDWSRESIEDAVLRVYQVARKSTPSPADLCKPIIANLQQRIQHGDVIDADPRREIDDDVYEKADVFFRNDPKMGPIFAIKRRLIQELCNDDVSSRDLAAALGKLGMIVRGSAAVPTRQVSIAPGRGRDRDRVRYWCIREAFAR